MPRSPTGTVVWYPAHAGKPAHYKARITLADGTRPWFDFDPSPRSPEEEARAREAAARLSARARREGIAATPRDVRHRIARGQGRETVAEYAERWLAPREAQGMSVRADRANFRNHVFPQLGLLPIAEVTKRDVKRFVEFLDDSVLAEAFRWTTARIIYGSVRVMLSDSCDSKREELCVREDDPTTGVRGPDRGDERKGPYLFPDEAAALFACDDVSVHDRALYAVAANTGLRFGELAALRDGDVSLAGGFITVSRSRDGETGREKGTKGKRIRNVRIEPSVRPLLQALLRNPLGQGGLLFSVPLRAMADAVRRHSVRAGLTRPALYAADDQVKPLGFHSLRHSYATWLALTGVTPMEIQQFGGWTDLALVNRYAHEAVALGRGEIGEPFQPLPEGLIKAVSEASLESSRDSSKGPRKRHAAE